MENGSFLALVCNINAELEIERVFPIENIYQILFFALWKSIVDGMERMDLGFDKWIVVTFIVIMIRHSRSDNRHIILIGSIISSQHEFIFIQGSMIVLETFIPSLIRPEYPKFFVLKHYTFVEQIRVYQKFNYPVCLSRNESKIPKFSSSIAKIITPYFICTSHEYTHQSFYIFIFPHIQLSNVSVHLTSTKRISKEHKINSRIFFLHPPKMFDEFAKIEDSGRFSLSLSDLWRQQTVLQ